MNHDAVVVGGGPAGLAAATWLARHRRRTLVVDSGEYRNRWVKRSHGYLTRDEADPAELREVARHELLSYPYAAVHEGRATAVRPDDGGGFVVTLDEDEVRAMRIVLACGVEDAFPTVEHFFDYYGVSVFHCPTCDGYEAAGKHVVALGWSEHVAGFALTLRDWASSVTIVTDGRRFPGDDRLLERLEEHEVRVLEGAAVRFAGTAGELDGVELATGECVPCDVAFFTVDHHPRTGLGTMLGVALTEEGCIRVDEHGETSVPGVYACGDVTPGMQLVQVAAAKGAVAGIACAMSLRGEDGAPGSPTPAPDVESVLNGDSADPG